MKTLQFTLHPCSVNVRGSLWRLFYKSILSCYQLQRNGRDEYSAQFHHFINIDLFLFMTITFRVLGSLLWVIHGW